MARFKTRLGRRRLRREEAVRTAGARSNPGWPRYLILGRGEAEVMAENGDLDAFDWVVHRPEATHFGVSDGEIVLAFTSVAAAEEWISPLRKLLRVNGGYDPV